jgi:uncharacterized protein (DUF488 family)
MLIPNKKKLKEATESTLLNFSQVCLVCCTFNGRGYFGFSAAASFCGGGAIASLIFDASH